MKRLTFKHKNKNKKGQMLFDAIILIIVILVVVIFFAAWKYVIHTMSTSLSSIGMIGSGINMTEISNETVRQYDTGLDMLQYVALAIFFGSVLSIFIHNYLIKVNSFFFVVYFLISVIVVIFAAYVSNVYGEMMKIQALSALLDYTMMTYIMLYLPYIMTAVCFIGLIFLFINYESSSGGGGGV